MEARQDILARNLRAIAHTSPAAARLIEATPPRTDLTFIATEDAAPSATLGLGPASRALASKRHPLVEAERFAGALEIESAGAFAITGFGLGHHVRAVAERLPRMHEGERRNGVLLVFEPDVALLRAVLERIDHSAWINDAHLALVTDPDDAGMISSVVKDVEGILALGVKLVRHMPSDPRLGPDADRFEATLTNVIRATRAKLVTTLMLVETTLRNKLQNVDHYATVCGIAELAGAASGRPAVVVAAGPSLERNIDLLAQPGVRDRVVIIAVQTVLKPLLERGIRPHFVTALDYHEISRRFYENLSPEDVEGVTLVAEPKVNPAVLEAFPGALRCPQDAFLDDVLGDDLYRRMGQLPDGATVAHLAYYLARHLACDPVILIGQDLGFTDGQYYASGAAIHTVWASELNEFNTLEMMEWQRIVRARRNLRALTDVDGRPIYTDEQMHSYLVQFERDFGADVARAWRVIDATEGGVRKQHTEVATLADALAAHANHAHPPLDLPAPTPLDRRDRIPRVDERLRQLRHDVEGVARDSRRARRLLEKMLRDQSDRARVNKLIEEVYDVDQRVKSRSPAFAMVQLLNQTGILNRYKADRAIEIESLDPLERQRRQIERDMTNVEWLADAADQLATLFDDARSALAGAPKRTRDAAPDRIRTPRARRVKAAAVIPVDLDRDALGRPRPLAEPLIAGRNTLAQTLRRLARCRRLSTAVLLTDQPARVRALVAGVEGIQVIIEQTDAPPMHDRAGAIRAARAWSAECWRGGLASFTCYDEALAPRHTLRVMAEHGLDAALILGADWCLVDPELIDQLIIRCAEDPEKHRIVFSQSPPGLGACLIERTLLAEFAGRDDIGPFASIAGHLGYVPVRPMSDPIAKPICVTIDAAVRDAHLRCIADATMRRRIARALAPLGTEADRLDARRIVQLLREDLTRTPDPMPSHVILDLPRLATDTPERILADLDATHTPITLAHPDPVQIPPLIDLARAVGPVHVRTDLRMADQQTQALLGADVVSIDLLADTAATYERLTGHADFDAVRARLHYLLDSRPAAPIRTPWIVPRITRRDEVYEEIEPFFDRWIMTAGCAVIDYLPAPIDGARIGPITLPAPYADRLARTTLTIRDDTDESVADLWRRALSPDRQRTPELAST